MCVCQLCAVSLGEEVGVTGGDQEAENTRADDRLSNGVPHHLWAPGLAPPALSGGAPASVSKSASASAQSRPHPSRYRGSSQVWQLGEVLYSIGYLLT